MFCVLKFQLLPFKYGVKLDGEDSIINGIPAADLMYLYFLSCTFLQWFYLQSVAVWSDCRMFCNIITVCGSQRMVGCEAELMTY